MDNVSCLIGITLASVTQEGDDIVFKTSDGRTFALTHRQDCCESVYVESIVGDLGDLAGEPIFVAEEVTSYENPQDYKPDGCQDSFTWTFYKFATRKGYVDIRFYGESNGYYSEGVDFEERK